MAVKRFAAIEVGSFELEMGIYEIRKDAGIQQIDRLRHVIALGKDTYNTGKISYELVEELLSVLSDFADIMKSYKVAGYHAYATSAMREAENSGIILDQIRVRTGLDVKVISNSEQRFLSFKAIAARDEQFNKTIRTGTAIVDVSFGSMQITLYDKGTIISTQNLPLGVLRLRELLDRISLSQEDRLRILGELVDNELATYRKMYLKDIQVNCVIGIGEPILMIFKRLSEAAGLNPKKDIITGEEFLRGYNYIVGRADAEIETMLGMDRATASVATPCMLVYRRVFELLGASVMWLPGTLMTDGIAAEYASDTKLIRLKHNFRDDIIEAARNIAKRYRCSGQHVKIVEDNADGIFSVMKKYHGLGERDRLLLKVSAILHNCGSFISMRHSGKAAFDIIEATEIIGLTDEEQTLVAKVIQNVEANFAYHETSMRTAKLTAILRLANSLDRSHRQKVTDYHFEMKEDRLLISTHYAGDMTLEFMAFERHKRFFMEIFGIEPVLKQKKAQEARHEK